MTLQDDLFSGTSWVQRRVPSSGTTVRLRLQAVGGDKVRVLEYLRQSARRDGAFHRVTAEEGRVVAFADLGLAVRYEELFR